MAEATTLRVSKKTGERVRRASRRLHLGVDEFLERLVREKEVVTPEEVAQFYGSLRRDEWVPIEEVRRRASQEQV